VMAESRVPVDLLNPGQVFACLGLMEAAEILCGPCQGAFDSDGRNTYATFRFAVKGDASPLPAVLGFLRGADVRAMAPRGSDLAVKEPGVVTEAHTGCCFPCRPPDAPAALPIRLTDGVSSVSVEHWADGSNRDNVKFWAGAGGYSGAALAKDALSAVASLDDADWRTAQEEPFDVEAPMSSSFRFDWRRDYVPLDLGFSLNKHGSIRSVGFPLVELLAAIGLEHARPVRVSRWDKLRYRYGVWMAVLPTALARCALGRAPIGFPSRRFRMRLDWPGQEDQARCIVDAQEE
jgi:CRISPR-associated protein Csb3